MTNDNDVANSIIEKIRKREIKRSDQQDLPGSFSYYFQNIYKALEDINIEANINFLNGDDRAVDTGNCAWFGLENLLLMIVLLENELKIDINFFTDYSDAEKIQNIKLKLKDFLK